MSKDETKVTPEVLESEASKVRPPNIGVLKIKYGKRRVHQGCCNTCKPQWRGGMESRKADAFQQAVLHAIDVHKWVPQV